MPCSGKMTWQTELLRHPSLCIHADNTPNEVLQHPQTLVQ
jgi:hypothetical protein